LTITEQDPSGWWYAMNDNGTEGFVPHNVSMFVCFFFNSFMFVLFKFFLIYSCLLVYVCF